ncbi:MAG: CCA tRNA nucleotidyltransferase [Pirellula sp.]|jgi:tRNA nucleotidyltransferase/poly(A) polymerase|nr:CCA tRNA nucleotidyltransferase [Pirellula sp.]
MPVWNESSDLYQFARDIVSRLQRAGYIAYFAGGCVRDALMGNPPNDYDVATSARLEQVIELFGPKNTLAIGAAFGVACVHRRIHGQRYQVEVATFRSDGTYSDGRHPDWVRFSRPEEDAQRRDFTINGMFFDPIAGELKDYVGGASDLAAKRIRAIGEADHRIEEDKLRMLRAVRFGARFGFDMDRETAEAIQRHAKEILVVSGERIAAEMSKLFETAKRSWGILELHRLGLLAYLWQELEQRWRDDPERCERAGRWLGALRSELDSESTMAASMALLWLSSQSGGGCALEKGEAKGIVQAIQSRWKLSNRVVEQAIFAMSHVVELRDGSELPWSVIQPILISEHARVAVEVASAVVESEGVAAQGVEYCRAALERPREELNPPPYLTGRDLHIAGLRPGPLFAELLREARVLQLDGGLQSREAALDWLSGHPSLPRERHGRKPSGDPP